MKIKKKYIQSVLLYSVMFLMFTYWPNWILDDVLCRLIILLLVAAYTINKGKLDISKRAVITLLLLFGLHCLVMLFGSRSYALDLGNIFSLLIGFIFVSTIQYNEFKEKYINLIYFISIFSSVTFVLNVIKPGFFSVFPVVKATGSVANVFFSLVPVGQYNYPRNYGCSGEPGMFAVYLSMAILLELFTRDSINLKHVIVFMITMVTTFSTSGYISFALIVCAFLCRGARSNGLAISKTEKYFLILMITTGIAIFFYLYLEGKLGLADIVLRKLTEFNMESGSSFERLRSVRLAIETIIHYFPFGAGWQVYEQIYLGGNILVATPLNWFAIYGVFYGIIMNIGVFLLACSMSKKTIDMAFIWLSMMALLVAQDMSSTYLFIIFIFYMFADKRLYNRTGERMRIRIVG